jgi:hypothetical protein
MSVVAEREWLDSRANRPDVVNERYRSLVPGLEPGTVWTLVQHFLIF